MAIIGQFFVIINLHNSPHCKSNVFTENVDKTNAGTVVKGLKYLFLGNVSFVQFIKKASEHFGIPRKITSFYAFIQKMFNLYLVYFLLS
jgi:hypothetical protein